MTRSSLRWTLTALLAATVAATSYAGVGVIELEQLAAEHPAQVSIVFENEHVWVARFHLERGDALPTHASGPRFVYSLSDYDLLHIPNYEPERVSSRRGEAHWHQREDHAVRNRGKTTAEYVAVISKPAPHPGPRLTGPCEVAEKAPEQAKVVFENNEGRVIRISLEPGESMPAHFAGSRVVYSLSDYQVRMGVSEIRFMAGQVHWHDACEAEVENTGKTQAELVVFEMKR